jgi:hypothetical protein
MSQLVKCAIWGTPAQRVEAKLGDFEVFDSPRAGGKYWISGTDAGQANTLNELAKLLLTSWLCEQRKAGINIPQINSDVLKIVKARRPMPFTARFDAALQFLEKNIKFIGDRVEFNGGTDLNLRFLAETECRSDDERFNLLNLLIDTEYIEGNQNMGGSGAYTLTTTGWQRLENLALRRSDSSQAFVAMWFHPSTAEAYDIGLAPAISSVGYRPIRIDQKDHINKIDDEIIAEIRRSRFLVADFTCEPKDVRGGVYFEAGFAMALPIPVIWTCKDTSIDDLHFDTRQYNHIVWTTPNELYEKLKVRIAAVIGDGPLRSN